MYKIENHLVLHSSEQHVVVSPGTEISKLFPQNTRWNHGKLPYNAPHYTTLLIFPDRTEISCIAIQMRRISLISRME